MVMIRYAVALWIFVLCAYGATTIIIFAIEGVTQHLDNRRERKARLLRQSKEEARHG